MDSQTITATNNASSLPRNVSVSTTDSAESRGMTSLGRTSKSQNYPPISGLMTGSRRCLHPSGSANTSFFHGIPVTRAEGTVPGGRRQRCWGQCESTPVPRDTPLSPTPPELASGHPAPVFAHFYHSKLIKLLWSLLLKY